MKDKVAMTYPYLQKYELDQFEISHLTHIKLQYAGRP